MLTLVFSLPLGLLVAFGRMSKIKPVQLITKIYISIMRGTPLMLQLLVVYFGPYYLFGMRLSTSYRFTATIIGFAVNYAAYFAEDLPIGDPVDPGRSAGSGEGARIHEKPDVF